MIRLCGAPHSRIKPKERSRPTVEPKFLGYSFWVAKAREVKRRVASKALEALNGRVREITARTAGGA